MKVIANLTAVAVGSVFVVGVGRVLVDLATDQKLSPEERGSALVYGIAAFIVLCIWDGITRARRRRAAARQQHRIVIIRRDL